MRPPKQPLQGEYVALPESRQLDVLADLLENRGAAVLRLPLVSILDAPDAAPIEQWLRTFIAEPCDYFIILTGEGLRRLVGFAERGEMISQARPGAADFTSDFGALADREPTVEMEIRASWTPVLTPDREPAELAATLGAWGDLLCTLAGLPPLPEGVVALTGTRR